MTGPLPAIGFQVWGQFTDWPQIAATALRMEDVGFASVYANDHLYPAAGARYQRPDAPPGPFLEGWITAAGIAAITHRVEVGVLVSSAAYRNVGLLVKQATALDHLSGGRAVLGLGAGWHVRDHEAFGFTLRPIGERLDQLEEQAAAARAMLGGETVSVHGRHVRLDRAVNLPPPLRPRLPLLLGGSGEKRTLRIVARCADIWNGEGDLATWTHRNAVLDGHCAAVGRDPAEIRRTVGLPPASVRPSREAAVAALADRLRANGLDADEARTDAEASPMAGTLDEVAGHLRAYAAAGAAEVLIDWPAPFDDQTLAALASLLDRAE